MSIFIEYPTVENFRFLGSDGGETPENKSSRVWPLFTNSISPSQHPKMVSFRSFVRTFLGHFRPNRTHLLEHAEGSTVLQPKGSSQYSISRWLKVKGTHNGYGNSCSIIAILCIWLSVSNRILSE